MWSQTPVPISTPHPPPQTMTERPPHEDPPHISFVVTGFGPFRGVQDNPTSALARDLPSYLASARPDLAARTSTLIIETSADDVLSSLAEIFDGLEARATGAVVLLHLGVDYRGKCFKVERCAYNDATFRVPDERGYQPVAEVCVDSHGHGHRFSTSLPVDALVRRMRSDPIKGAGGDTAGGFTVNLVQPSSDPGRFVCNFTYAQSLNRAEIFNGTMSGEDGITPRTAPTVHSLFLHVPPITVVPMERQMHFVVGLMEAIGAQLDKDRARRR